MIADYLLTDDRVQKVAEKIRQEFPRLPEGCEFATYVQAPVEVEHNGIVRQVPAQAVFGIQTPNPRRPTMPRLHRASCSLQDFQTMDRSMKHYVGYPDPVLHMFRQVAPQAIDWYETQRDLQDPVV